MEYLAVGHVTEDIQGNGDRSPGGTVLFAALTAKSLGIDVGVVTSCADLDLFTALTKGTVLVENLASPATTTFETGYNCWGQRSLKMTARARTIETLGEQLSFRDVGIVHYGPVANEVPVEVLADLSGTPLRIASAQGWLRECDVIGAVHFGISPVIWRLPTLVDVIIISDEDLDGDYSLVTYLAQAGMMVVITSGPGKITSVTRTQSVTVNPPMVYPRAEPCGAGDVFATMLGIAMLKGASESGALCFAASGAADFVGRGGNVWVV